MRPSSRVSFRRGLERLLGTALGVLVAVLCARLWPHSGPLITLIGVASFFVPLTLNRYYWITSALVGMIVLLLLDLASNHLGTAHLAWVRVVATAIGFLGILVGVAIYSLIRPANHLTSS